MLVFRKSLRTCQMNDSKLSSLILEVTNVLNYSVADLRISVAYECLLVHIFPFINSCKLTDDNAKLDLYIAVDKNLHFEIPT